MTDIEEPDEATRLAARAAAIWGDPFSPEAMAADAAMKAPEREFNDKIRYRRMADLDDYQE